MHSPTFWYSKRSKKCFEISENAGLETSGMALHAEAPAQEEVATGATYAVLYQDWDQTFGGFMNISE